MLACTPTSPSAWAFTSATTCGSGPELDCVLLQSPASGVDVTTYLDTALMKSANGCSSEVGQ